MWSYNAPIYSSEQYVTSCERSADFQMICNGEREEDSEEFFVQREESKPLPSRQPGQPGKGPPEGGPEGSGGFACRCVRLFDLRLANDDLRTVEREIIELHVEAPTVFVDPGAAPIGCQKLRSPFLVTA